jgi:hypothetical protein
MAQQIINNGASGLSVRTKINENFSEVYSYLSVNDAVGDGAADDTAALVAQYTAENRYILQPGKTYRVTAPLPLNNYTEVIGNGATFLIDHAGTAFANNTGGSILFVRAENFNIRTNRVNGSSGLLVSGMSRSLFTDIRIDRAGSGQSFGIGVRVQNGPGVSLWNTFFNIHVTCATGTGFFVDDNANDNTFYGCRLVNSADLELARGLYFGACSGSQFDGGSLEAVFKNGVSEANVVEFAAAATECLVQRTRAEGYSGSADAFAVKWNGSVGNSIIGFLAAGLTGAIRDAVGRNTYQAGDGSHYLGGTQVRIPISAGAPAVDAGAIKFNTTNSRFQGFRDSARDFCMSPAFFAHDMGNQRIDNCQLIALADGITAPAAVAGQAILFVDSADGDLKVRFGDGLIKAIAFDT